MRVLLLGLGVAMLTLAIPVSGQAEAVDPSLTLGEPEVASGGRILIDPETSIVAVEWAYRAPRAAAPGEAHIEWEISCIEGSLVVTPIDTVITFEAGIIDYTGVALLPVSATPGTPGVQELACTVTGTARTTNGAPDALGSVPFAPVAAYRGEISVTAPVVSKMSGPQKVVPYVILVTNLGNARTLVEFEIVDRPSGKTWAVVVPDAVVIEVGETVQAILRVATSYDTGPNDDRGTIVLRAVPQAASDPESIGTPQEIEVTAKVRGWYIPGPSLALVLVGFAALALLRRNEA